MTRTARPLPARTMARLRKAAGPDSIRLSDVAVADLMKRGLFEYDTWSLTREGRLALNAEPPKAGDARATRAGLLRSGLWVRMFDEEVGSHVRQVSEARVASWDRAYVVVDWVGDDLAATHWHRDTVLEVYGV